jgi:hypothetical protein
MTVTIGSMVDEVLADLYQYATTRPQFCTFQKWVTNGSDITGVELGDAAQQIINSYVELASGELIYVSNHGSGGNGSATVPSWFRAQLGSKPVDGVPENSKATIDPVWTRFGVSQKVVAGIESLYPDLFGVDEVVFPSTVQQSNYELPDDCDGVIAVTVEMFGPTNIHFPVRRWTFDPVNADGKKYLRVAPMVLAGRPIRVTYRKRPVVPEAGEFDVSWESVGLPASAADLPVRYALTQLIVSPDMARTQSHSIPQSQHNRFVPLGSTAAVSRRLEETFRLRLRDERRKLVELHPVQVHKAWNG